MNSRNSTTAQRLRQIMEERGLRQVDILNLCAPICEKFKVKIARNDLSQYVSGKTQPKQDKLSVLGMALGVSETWLMGYDEADPSPIEESNARINEFVDLFSQLSEDQQKMIVKLIKGILSDND